MQAKRVVVSGQLGNGVGAPFAIHLRSNRRSLWASPSSHAFGSRAEGAEDQRLVRQRNIRAGPTFSCGAMRPKLALVDTGLDAARLQQRAEISCGGDKWNTPTLYYNDFRISSSQEPSVRDSEVNVCVMNRADKSLVLIDLQNVDLFTPPCSFN